MATIVTICGTSLLTNTARVKGFDLASIARNANVASIDKVPAEDRDKIVELLSDLDTSLEFSSYFKLSAEINSLGAYYRSINRSPKGDRHILISTDTWLGSLAAQKIATVLKQVAKEDDILIKTVPGLRTNDSKEFREGCSSLLITLFNLHLKASNKQESLVLNLTGGFKSVLMTLQSFAMLYSIPSFNLFEFNPELLWLPQLPFKFDHHEFVVSHLKEFRLLTTGLFQGEIPPALDFAIYSTNDNQHMLSEWGELLWATERSSIYRSQLFEPPVDLMKFAPGFQKQAETFARASDKLEELNNKIDIIAKLIASNNTSEGLHLDGTKIKKLKGRTTDVGTHEIYASNDNATRIYCHRDGLHWILDRLGKHL